MIQVIGYDPNGVARVYGQDAVSRDVAETRCREEAVAYVARRPDTAPLSSWTFTEEPNQ